MNSSNTPEREERPSGSRREAVFALAVITGTGLLCLLCYRRIMEFAQTWILPCALLAFTGLRCPLCGGTRCVRAMVQLDLAEAFYYNPLVVLTAVWCVYMYVRLIISCCRKDYVRYSPFINSEKGLWVALAIYILFFIVRNLPIYQQYLY